MKQFLVNFSSQPDAEVRWNSAMQRLLAVSKVPKLGRLRPVRKRHSGELNAIVRDAWPSFVVILLHATKGLVCQFDGPCWLWSRTCKSQSDPAHSQ
jgi:hypothetical protein